MRRIFNGLLWVGSILLLSFASTGPARAIPAHYVVFEVSGSSVEPLFHRRVELAEIPGLHEDRQRAMKAEADRGGEIIWVDVRTATASKAVFTQAVRLPPIRAEFHGAELHGAGSHGAKGQIDGTSFYAERQAFVLRLPVVERATLHLSGTVEAELDLDTLGRRADSLPLAGLVSSLETKLTKANGNPANRADFLIMGDGYTATQRNRFTADANRLQNEFFSISPYREYRSYANISQLFVASAQAGADHPPFPASCSAQRCCSDGAAQGDPLAGTFVDTAFDATFCTGNIQRLLTVDTGKVLAAASAAPNWDQILVLVNDATFGGAGGLLAVASTHEISAEIVQHEVGHSFTRLADEYETSVPGFNRCTDAAGTCAANITDRSVREQVKWRPWIQSQTPVPTPESPAWGGVVGVFEGGHYHSVGQFRPRFDCQMRNLGQEFCEVCAQEYVLRLLRGGFGVPSNGIDPIEPGTEQPSTGLVNAGSQPIALSARLLEPSAGTPLSVTWRVDGQTVAGAGGSSFTFEPEQAGTYEVELEVDAANSFVHPAMGGDSLKSFRRWTVSSEGVTPPLDADFEVTGDQAGAAIFVTDQSRGEPTRYEWDFGDGNGSTDRNPTHLYESAGIYDIRLTIFRDSESSSRTQTVRIYAGDRASCLGDETEACLGGDQRFKVEVLWRDFDGSTGAGRRVVPHGSQDSAMFEFFGADNWELLVKLLDACGFDQRYWVFASATSNVEYALRVIDTATSDVREYLNPAGNSSPSITDTNAFSTCGSPPFEPTFRSTSLEATEPQQPADRYSVAPGEPCDADDPTHLCLLDGAFDVTLDWRDPQGTTGSAQLTPARSDGSGVLWFFDPANWELLVKVLDGCALNDHFWVFAAAGTNVEYTLRARHVESGEVVEYFNPLGRASPPITDTSALVVCPEP